MQPMELVKLVTQHLSTPRQGRHHRSVRVVSSPASRLQLSALVGAALHLKVSSGGVTTRTRREFADGLAFNRNNQFDAGYTLQGLIEWRDDLVGDQGLSRIS